MNELILGPQVPVSSDYFDQTFIAKARQHGLACPATPPTNEGELNSFVLLHYYDLALVLYIAYRRTGDAQFLALARNAADSWYKHPGWIGEGRIRLFPDSASPPPRHVGLGGLISRAIDEREDMWDWINAFHRASWATWIRIPRADAINPQLHYGLREGAFVLQHAAWLAKSLPDSFPLLTGGVETNGAALRAQYVADIESACVNYFGRLQLPDGSWRWNTTADEPRDSDGGTWVGIMQPFMVGLTTSALIDAHQVVQTPSVKANIQDQILRACRHLYSDGPYVKDEVEVRSGKRIRGFHYFYHGGTSVDPTKYANGDIKFPWTAEEAWWLPSARQAISTILPAFGYAYKLSGDEFYKNAGDELYDAAYSGRDGVRAMLDDTAKNFNQHGRRVCSYRAWTGGAVIEPPLPSEPPRPTEPPKPTEPPTTPTIPPTDSVPVVVITAPVNGAIVTGQVNVTVSVTNPAGITESYLIVDGVVAAGANSLVDMFSLDAGKLGEGSHSMYVRMWKGSVPFDSKVLSVTVKNVGEPPIVIPPTPVEPPIPPVVEPPIPPIPPAPTCTITVPEQFALPPNSSSTLTVAVVADPSLLPFQVSATAADGQITVTPSSQRVDKPSMLLAFNVRTKKRSSSVKFTSRCGQKVTKIIVR